MINNVFLCSLALNDTFVAEEKYFQYWIIRKMIDRFPRNAAIYETGQNIKIFCGFLK